MITIVNGESQAGQFSQDVKMLAQNWAKTDEVKYFQLSQFNIKNCTGCWSCWWKTPGLCSVKDDFHQMMEPIIHSDLLVFASPLVAGFPSYMLKRFQDRLIILLHPYIEPIQGECHHRKRYDRYPDLALLLEKEPDTDDEDIEIVTDIYKRLAINFHSNLRHVWFMDQLIKEETVYELSNI